MAAELTPTERAAYITIRLYRGERLTNADVAAICAYEHRASAYYLMMRLARVMPLSYCEGVWFLLDGDGDGCEHHNA